MQISVYTRPALHTLKQKGGEILQHDLSDTRFLTTVRRRNASGYVITLLCMRQAMRYIVAFIAGALLTQTVLPKFLALQLSVVPAFTTDPFATCHLARHYVETVLAHAAPDLVMLVLLILTGCTLFSEQLSGMLCAIHAFYAGSLVCAVVLDGKSGASLLPVVGFGVLRTAISLLFVLFSCRAVLFSYEYRRVGTERSTGQAGECFRHYLCLATVYLGATVLLHTLHCLFLYGFTHITG